MDIPESINKLTEVRIPDLFNQVPAQIQFSVEDIINIIKQKLDSQNYKSFEEGVAYYKKDTISDRGIFKNLCSLYCDSLMKSVQTSDISEDNKQDVIKAISTTFSGIAQNLDAINNLAFYLNKNKNIIDVQRFSYIILGYVIDTIKRINYTKQ